MSKSYSSPFKLSTLIFISLLSFTSRSLCQIDSVHIHGEFSGLTLKKNSLITFHVNDFVLGRQLSYYSSVDSAGRFDIKFPMRCTQDIFWLYDEDSLFSLIVSPKDSLTITVDKAGVHFFGRNAKASEEINFMRKLNESAFPQSLEDRALARLEPEDYFVFQKTRLQKQIKLLDSICGKQSCSALFRQWYLADCDVNFYRKLLTYSWRSPQYSLGSGKKLGSERWKKYYFSFINAKDIRVEGLGDTHLNTGIEKNNSNHQYVDLADNRYSLSSTYESLVHNLSNYTINHPLHGNSYLKDKTTFLLEYRNELSAKEIQLLEGIRKTYKTEAEIDSMLQDEYYKIARRYKDQLSTMITKRYIDWEVSRAQLVQNSNVRELILCQNFSNYILTEDDADYYFNSISPLISNASYLDAITREYNDLRISIKETNQLLLSEADVKITIPDEDKSGDQLINSILYSNKNKVILIDLWGTWCGPCLADFTRMAQLKSTPPFDSVRFVYFCCKSKEKDWLFKIKKYNVKGTHYLLTDKQYADLEKRFKFKGFPSYFIIDKHRKLHRDILVTNSKALTGKINSLLNE